MFARMGTETMPASRKKALTTGKLTHRFVLQIPDAHWDIKDEAALSPSASEASDYFGHESESGSDHAEEKEADLKTRLELAKDRARERAQDSEEECSEDEDDEDEDEEEDDEHRARRRLVEIHKAMFALFDNYRFLEQVTSSSPHCYTVEDPEFGVAVLKITKMTSPSHRPPKEVRCMVRCKSVPGVLRLLRWHSLPDEYYAFLSPLMKDHCVSLLYEDAAKVRSYMRQALTVLAGCHRQGVMHRDVKIGNFFWDDNTGVLTLTDFDCATMDPERLRTHTVGTHGFMSPEMRAGKGYTWKNDVYSLGVVFGMLLFRVSSENDITDALVGCWATNTAAGNKKKQRKSKAQADKGGTFYGTPAARRLLVRMLAKNPADRPTYEEALRDPYFSE